MLEFGEHVAEAVLLRLQPLHLRGERSARFFPPASFSRTRVADGSSQPGGFASGVPGAANR
jgi:hypothetical protein